MPNVRITGAVTSKKGVTLYLDSGNEINLRMDSGRTREIMNKITPILAQGKSVEINTDDFSIERIIEKRTNGVVKFFRRVKSALGLGSREETYDIGLKEDEEIVAVVNGKEIPGVERIQKQMERAAYGKDAKGFQRFMERLASVVEERGHSVDELLSFMRKGDLPIADDGTIIAYKLLYKREDCFVDPHTKKVTQKIGSFVAMDPKLIDPDKRKECSTGLHVGRRDYMGSFSGDTMMLIKVRPEDVIAVPYNESSKMRVAGYHIVAKLNDEGKNLIKQNLPMTKDLESAKLLGNVVAGAHIGIKENVVIGGPYGSDIRVIPVDDAAEQIPISDIVERAFDDVKNPQILTPREIRKTVEAARNQAAATGDMSAAINSEPAAHPDPVTAPLSESEKKVVKKAAPAKSKTKVSSNTDNVWDSDLAKEKLSDKQREALRVMAQDGLSLRKTAKQLGMSHHTINRAQEILGIKK